MYLLRVTGPSTYLTRCVACDTDCPRIHTLLVERTSSMVVWPASTLSMPS